MTTNTAAAARTSLQSKVMKAAWKIFREGYKHHTMANWSKALRRAWAWAKETLNAAKIWRPKGNPTMARAYFPDGSYAQFNLGRARGYYAAHRAAKGDNSERPVYFKLSGGDAASATHERLAGLADQIFGSDRLVASKF